MVQATTKLRITPQVQPDAGFHERRQSPRYRLRDVRGRLSWHAADGQVDSDVTVINISGGGAAVLAEQRRRPIRRSGCGCTAIRG